MLRRVVLLVLLVAFSSTVLAQYDNPRKKRSVAGSRDTRFETSVILAYQNGLDETSEGGSALDVDSTMGWGVNIGWNWTAKWNLAYRFISTSPKYLATIVPEDPDALPQTIEHKLSKISHQFNVTYNFREAAFTPFVLAGIGWTKLDSNVPTGELMWGVGGTPGGVIYVSVIGKLMTPQSLPLTWVWVCVGILTMRFSPGPRIAGNS